MMEKVQVISASPSACVGRGTIGLSGPPLPHTDHEYFHHHRPANPLPNSSAHKNNVLNNNVEVNGLSNANSVNNNKKRSTSKDQGSVGYVSERVRALSVSHNRQGATNSQKFGPPDLRASYNERLRSFCPPSLQPVSRPGRAQDVGGGFLYVKPANGGLYRSNSSLDLDHEEEDQPTASSPLRREYGSHGSINVISATHTDNFFTILRDLKGADPTGTLLNPGAVSSENVAASLASECEATSPKVRSKFQKLWGDKDKPSIFRKLRSSKSTESKSESKTDVSSDPSGAVNMSRQRTLEMASSEVDSRSSEDTNNNGNSSRPPTRRSAFAHYDCRSIAAQLNSAHLRTILAERTNTTTGASAAALAGLGSGSCLEPEDIRLEESDPGDRRSNNLVSSCPFFRNELGGEGERVVSLSRDWLSNRPPGMPVQPLILHRPISASTISLLEPQSSDTHWRHSICPYTRNPNTIENSDQGATYYRTYFHGQEHQNWFGIDEGLGPVAVSIRREKVEDAMDTAHSLPSYQYRVIVRTSELYTCQGTILEESLIKGSGEKGRGISIRDLLEYVCPQLSTGCLRLGLNTMQTEEALLKLDDLGVYKKFKVGVLYSRAGQTTEEEMYNNEDAGPAFSEFLEMLGQRVRLKDFDKYRGGLDRKTDSTGLYSVYTQYQDCEIMFHVSTLLPFTPNNRKQLLRKRHIGNDIVTIIFQEPGAPPFSPKNIRSHFQHVFVIVQALNPCSDNTQYSVSVSRFKDIPMFGPPLPEGITFRKSRAFTDFLLAKIINGQIAALCSEKFTCMATRTRHEYLKDLSLNHTSAATMETSSKFSLMGFSRSGRKEKMRVKYIPDSAVKGALSWPVTVHDAALQQNVEGFMGISVDSVVIVEESSAAVIFAAPCKSVIGWTTKANQGVKLFYHQGECLLINIRPGTLESEGEEIISELVARLAAVTQGAETQELALKRNPAGLLGFNVQQDGIITEVEPYGLAAQAGLKQGARLVEICTVALATLTQEQMVDLLKTSITVTVTIVPPHRDDTPRRGCNVSTCGFLLGGAEGDYENLNTPEEVSRKHSKSRHTHSTRYDRSLSPPRSSNSSGYGTGSSSRSFNLDNRTPQDYSDSTKINQGQDFVGERGGDYQQTGGDYERTPDYTGTMSSTSSGHSHSSTDRWMEEPQDSPPPLPARVSQGSKRRGDLLQSSFYNRAQPNNPLNSSPNYASSLSSSSSTTTSNTNVPHHHHHQQSSSPHTASLHHHHHHHHHHHPPSQVHNSQNTPFTTSPHSNNNNNNNNNNNQSTYALPANTMGVYALPPSRTKTVYGGDGTGDHSNYAVPPSHPRPFNPDLGEEGHYAGYSDYDNAPAKPQDPSIIQQQQQAQVQVQQASQQPQSQPHQDLGLKSSTEGPQLSEYMAWRNEQLNTRSSSFPNTASSRLVHDENSSSLERLHPSRSEDELSVGSTSPHTRRRLKGGNTTPSSSSSRNQSPRTIAEGQRNEARLRHGPTPRKTSNRNSANLGSSNLQEELFRLINPDYMSDTESMVSNRENTERPRSHTVSLGSGSGSGGSHGMQSSNSSLDRASIKSGSGVSNSSQSGTILAVSGPPPAQPPPQSIAQSHPQDPLQSLSGLNHRPFPVNSTSNSQNTSPQNVHYYQETTSSQYQYHSSAVPTGQYQAANKNSTVTTTTTVKTETAPEVVVLTARPATVISASSAASSPAPAPNMDLKGSPNSREHAQGDPVMDNLAPIMWRDMSAKDAPQQHQPPLPHPQQLQQPQQMQPPPQLPPSQQPGLPGADPGSLCVDQEWTTLVHTATRAIEKSGHLLSTGGAGGGGGGSGSGGGEGGDTGNAGGSRNLGNGSQHESPKSIRCPESNACEASTLHEKIVLLEKALAEEQQRSEHLEDEVSHLRADNKKLQEDSRAAAQQLHQFTEWFFNTIDKS
ncbi:uncharacterized protein LOC143023421 [Oratosquilla oratoria]|uniref:uncharacterized protein LOC143023421 n=1 Tax=Oratosquilla oratoria TaxID=337810 RepID=UPI003F75E22F